jgi:hypothetical protein
MLTDCEAASGNATQTGIFGCAEEAGEAIFLDTAASSGAVMPADADVVIVGSAAPAKAAAAVVGPDSAATVVGLDSAAAALALLDGVAAAAALVACTLIAAALGLASAAKTEDAALTVELASPPAEMAISGV